MYVRTPRLFALIVGASFAANCGGAAESAEEPAGTGTPAVEAPAEAPAVAVEPVVAEPAPAVQAAPVPAASPRPARTKPTPPAPESEPEAPPVVAPAPSVSRGATLTLTLDAALSTEANKAGDPFSARLNVDLLAEDGEVLLPAGTLVRGVVTEAMESPSADKPAVLRLSVEDIWVDGRILPVVAEVEDVQLKADTKDRNRETVAKVAAGAAAGAVLGKILGGSAKTGAAVGAAAGTVVAVTTRDGQASIPQGSLITIRILETLVLR